ncbi:hypothetical protein [Pseudomonas anguilliseptica]|uniref:hypothetical protein n=1 Tax=Pseudomonas anguilliseptica TaxID=53406 RepID=UPI00325B3044
MKMLKLLQRATPSIKTTGLLVGSMAVAGFANAAEGDLDLSTMIAAVSGTAVVAAFVGMGIVKLGPNFARWAINKVASFF